MHGVYLLLGCLAAVTLAAESDGTTRPTHVFNPTADPLGEYDVYRAVVDSDTEGKWEADPAKTLRDRFNSLLNVSVATHIDVKLVGFSGDGNYRLNVQTADFVRFLEASLAEDSHVYATNPKTNIPNQLPIRHKYFFRVIKAKPQLVTDITKVVHKNVLGGGKSAVPVEDVDNLIRSDYEATSGSAYTIYLLNPKAAAVTRTSIVNMTDPKTGQMYPEEKTERDLYTYYYKPTPSDPNDKLREAPCPTVLWAGKGLRYAWIDLTAGPISYGPHTNGNGLVSDFSIPNLENFKLEDQDNEEHGVHEDDFIAEVTSLVVKTCGALVQPTLHSFPVPFARKIKINIVEMVHDPSHHAKDLKSKMDVSSLQYDLMLNALHGQSIEVSTKVVALQDCKLCHAALNTATMSRTSTIMRGGLRTAIHDYVDSKLLYQTLRGVLLRSTELTEMLGLEGFIRSEPTEIVIPVFLFDLRGHELVLLDRHHSAVAFPDAVVAIQSEAPVVTTDYSCGDGPLSFDARDASRAILAALLESVWGVASPAVFYNPALAKEEIDFTWLVGNCPWGPFSRSSALSFAQSDAMKRNILYSEIHSSTSMLASIVETFFKYDQGIADILLPAEYSHFLRRFNIFDYKLEKATMFMSLLDYDSALYYARSMRHDVRALANIFSRASDFIHSHMVCAQDTEESFIRDLVYASCVFVIVAVAWKSRKIFFPRSRRTFAKSD